MIALLVISLLQVEAIVRGPIDEGCSFSHPVWGKPVDGTDATGCLAREDLITIRYPDFQSMSFLDIQHPVWVKICGVTKALIWRNNYWIDYDIDQFRIIRHHLRVPVAPGQLLYIQDCLDRHLFYRTWGEEKGGGGGGGATTTTTTTTRITKAATTRSRPKTTVLPETTTTTTTTRTTTTTTTRPQSTKTEKTGTTATVTMRPRSTTTTRTTTTGKTRSTAPTTTPQTTVVPGAPSQLWVVYVMVSIIVLVAVFITYLRCCRYSISINKRPECVQMQRLVQLPDEEEGHDAWIDINRHSIHYRRLITENN